MTQPLITKVGDHLKIPHKVLRSDKSERARGESVSALRVPLEACFHVVIYTSLFQPIYQILGYHEGKFSFFLNYLFHKKI